MYKLIILFVLFKGYQCIIQKFIFWFLFNKLKFNFISQNTGFYIKRFINLLSLLLVVEYMYNELTIELY